MDLRKKFAEFMKDGKEDVKLQDRIRELEFQLHDANQRLAAAQFKVPEIDLQAGVNAPTEFTENPGVYPEDQPMSNTEMEELLKKLNEDRLKQEKVQNLGEWPFEDETESGVSAVREAAQVDALLTTHEMSK